MPTWVTLTDADVRLSTAERERLDNLKPDGVDLAAIVTAAANYARGYVGARFELAEAPQVPPEIVDDVLAIALVNYLAVVPGHKLLDDGRKTARDNALQHLRDIGTGKATVSPPDLPIGNAVQSTGPSPAGINVPCRQVTKCSQSRL